MGVLSAILVPRVNRARTPQGRVVSGRPDVLSGKTVSSQARSLVWCRPPESVHMRRPPGPSSYRCVQRTWPIRHVSRRLPAERSTIS
jgi:hypothetical protein